jgi:hypothetical protein
MYFGACREYSAQIFGKRELMEIGLYMAVIYAFQNNANIALLEDSLNLVLVIVSLIDLMIGMASAS